MLIQKRQDKPLKQANCVVNDVKPLANQCRYGYMAAYFNGLCKYSEDKIKQ